MPCFDPIEAFLPVTGEKSLKFSISALEGRPYRSVKVSCGKCLGCRMSRSREWALRCCYEASLYSENCFVTLTYDNANLPSDCSLVPEHLTKFIKRLRKANSQTTIRYFACGEYGSKYGRPHFHILLFNFDFSDKELISLGQNRLFKSLSLSKLWPFGFSTIGDVTEASAAYVARYIFKKDYGIAGLNTYADRHPEYITMSRRPGIAAEWFARFTGDCFPHDYCLDGNGRKRPVPRYFVKLFERYNPDSTFLSTLKETRSSNAAAYWAGPDTTPERLDAREAVLFSKLTRLDRNYEGTSAFGSS